MTHDDERGMSEERRATLLRSLADVEDERRVLLDGEPGLPPYPFRGMTAVELRALLSREPARPKPASRAAVDLAATTMHASDPMHSWLKTFTAGARWAERFHGIAASEEREEKE